MDGRMTLPGRTEVGEGSFSPWIDRFSLAIFVFAAIFAHGPISEFLEDSGGAHSGILTACGLVILVPVMATSLGKLIVRLFD